MSHEEQVLVAWEKRVKVLGNPAMWLYVVIAFGIGSCLVGILFAVLTDIASGVLFAVGGFAFFLVVSFLAMLGIDLMGGLKTSFAVTSLGSRSVASKAVPGISWTAVAGGLLMGNAAAAGAGLLATTEQSLLIEHKDVRTVAYNERSKVILLRKQGWAKPVALYCLDEAFHPALDVLKDRCPQATFVSKSILL